MTDVPGSRRLPELMSELPGSPSGGNKDGGGGGPAGERARFHLRTKVARQAADGGSAVCIFVRGSESCPEPWPTLAPPVYLGLEMDPVLCWVLT